MRNTLTPAFAFSTILAALILVVLHWQPAVAQDDQPAPAGDDAPAAGDDAGDDQPGSGDGAPAAGDDEPALQFDRVARGDGAEADATFKGFKEGKLRFASGFGDLAVAPGDVKTVRFKDSPRTMYLKESKRSDAREVRVIAVDGELRVYEPTADPSTAQKVDFASLFEMSDEPIPSEVWTGNIAATLSIGRGNTEDVAAGIEANLSRETNWDKISFHYEFGYTETGVDPTTVSRRYHLGSVEYRYFLDDTWSLFAKNTLRHDLLAGLEYRNTTDIGGSVQAIKEDDGSRSLRFDLSVNHVFERNRGEKATNYAGGTAALDFMQKIDEPIVFMFFASISEDFSDTDNWVATLRATFKNDLGEGFALSLVAQMDYDNLPAPGFRQTDFRLTAVLGWTFGW